MEEMDSLMDEKPPASRPRRNGGWKTVFITAAATLAVVAAAGAALWRVEPVRRAVVSRLAPPPSPWHAKRDFNLRRVVLDRRDQALARGDLKAAALVNADLAQEALLRARATERVWVARKQDAGTKLFPRTPDMPYWMYRDCGADLYGFLLQAGVELDPESLPALSTTS
jgi:hypothetical protein